MKLKTALFIISFVLVCHVVTAQWQGTGPVYTMDNVGIKTAPDAQLEVAEGIGTPAKIRITKIEDDDYHWDISNDGISLHFIRGIENGNYLNAMSLKWTNGYVGIGTTNPTYRLQAQGDIYANGGWFRVGGQQGLIFQSYGGGFRMTDNTWIRTYGNKSFYHNTGIMRTDGTFQVGSSGNRFIVNTSGRVGIGTTTPDHELEVNGTIQAEEIIVANVSADFVFQEGYELRPLIEVERYIQENGHLPGVPPASETEKGIKVSEFNTLLLQKIEELTLYIIELEKKLESNVNN